MPFRSVRLETTSRLFELQALYRVLVANEANLPVPAEHQMLKGHFIVGLYAYIEFSVQQLIRSAVANINSAQAAHKHLTPEIFTLLSEPKFMAAEDTRGERKWNNRADLLSRLYTNEICIIADNILQREIQNTRVSTIELTFKLFSIRHQPIDASISALPRYINEIGERRNAVAHGRESASEVGGRYSAGALGDRLTALEAQTTYMIACFEDGAASKSYLRPSCRRLYA